MTDSYSDKWSDWQNDRLAELRAEVARPIKSVRADVARKREQARQASEGRRHVPTWAEDAAKEQAEEKAVMAAYESSPPHVRAWLDGIAADRLIGHTHPDLFRDRVLLDVLLLWKARKLETPEDDQ